MDARDCIAEFEALTHLTIILQCLAIPFRSSYSWILPICFMLSSSTAAAYGPFISAGPQLMVLWSFIGQFVIFWLHAWRLEKQIRTSWKAAFAQSTVSKLDPAPSDSDSSEGDEKPRLPVLLDHLPCKAVVHAPRVSGRKSQRSSSLGRSSQRSSSLGKSSIGKALEKLEEINELNSISGRGKSIDGNTSLSLVTPFDSAVPVVHPRIATGESLRSFLSERASNFFSEASYQFSENTEQDFAIAITHSQASTQTDFPEIIEASARAGAERLEEAATQTALSWSGRRGFTCSRCARPPQLPRGSSLVRHKPHKSESSSSQSQSVSDESEDDGSITSNLPRKHYTTITGRAYSMNLFLRRWKLQYDGVTCCRWHLAVQSCLEVMELLCESDCDDSFCSIPGWQCRECGLVGAKTASVCHGCSHGAKHRNMDRILRCFDS